MLQESHGHSHVAKPLPLPFPTFYLYSLPLEPRGLVQFSLKGNLYPHHNLLTIIKIGRRLIYSKGKYSVQSTVAYALGGSSRSDTKSSTKIYARTKQHIKQSVVAGIRIQNGMRSIGSCSGDKLRSFRFCFTLSQRPERTASSPFSSFCAFLAASKSDVK